MAAAKPIVVFVLGNPGSGKGTQCSRIVENFGFKHLSAGDLLRAERATGSDLADLINGYICEGKIVPVKITCGLIEKAMKESAEDKENPINKFLIDGFPRNADNLEGWTEAMADKVDFRFTLFLNCPAEICEERVLERAKSSGRKDDNKETLAKRFRTYETETRPIIETFKAEGKLREVDATKDVETVYAEVKAAFEDI